MNVTLVCTFVCDGVVCVFCLRVFVGGVVGVFVCVCFCLCVCFVFVFVFSILVGLLFFFFLCASSVRSCLCVVLHVLIVVVGV